MSIKSSLKNLVIECGGTPTANTISGLIDQIVDAKNPLSALTVDTTFGAAASDLLGKAATDLQENIVIENGAITGTLKYVTGYTGFSGLESEQSGNYLVLHYSVPDVTGVTIAVQIGSKAPVTLDPDGIHIILVKETGSKKIMVTATKDGHVPVVKTFDISGIELEEAGD